MLLSWFSGATSMYHGQIDPTAPRPEGAPLSCESGEPPNPVCLRQITPFSIYVVARVLSALLSLVTVAVVYTGGRQVFDRRVGLLAALLVGLCPMVVQIAHYENPGATTLLVSSTALFVSLRLMRKIAPSRKLYASTGLLVGLSAAARYNAAVVGVVFLLACFMTWRRQRRFAPILIGCAAIPLVFLIGTPGALFEFRVFFDDVRYILFWYGSAGGGPGWTSTSALQAAFVYWRYMFLIVLGPVVLVAAIVGLFRLLKSYRAGGVRFWTGIGLAAYLVCYTLLALTSKRLNANLLIPMITPVALLGAYGFWQVIEAIRVNRELRFGAAIVLVAWPAFLSVYLAGMFAAPDSRMLAQAWIHQRIPQNTPVHLLGSYNVPLDPLNYPTNQTFGGVAAQDDPLWDSSVIVYSDAYPHAILRDATLTEDPVDIENTEATLQRLQTQWVELARFPRAYWPGQDIAPDDVSYWHQMEIVVYCNPANCPV
jgi:4-amino-4-deoxy-L-arabinose transferase-like glycosyltransferase